MILAFRKCRFRLEPRKVRLTDLRQLVFNAVADLVGEVRTDRTPQLAGLVSKSSERVRRGGRRFVWREEESQRPPAAVPVGLGLTSTEGPPSL